MTDMTYIKSEILDLNTVDKQNSTQQLANSSLNDDTEIVKKNNFMVSNSSSTPLLSYEQKQLLLLEKQ